MKRFTIFIALLFLLTGTGFAADQTIKATEEMVGSGHATKTDTLNRMGLVGHNTDGTHKAAISTLGGTLTVDETSAMSSKAPKASPIFTGVATAPVFNSLVGSALTVANTPVTMLTLPNTLATYLVTANVGAQGLPAYSAVGIVQVDTTGVLTIISTGGSIALTLSGLNLQIQITSNGISGFVYAVRIAS
jgi:hypothetical protein